MSWAEAPAAGLMPDGRLRLTHGPIDVIIKAEGTPDTVQRAFERAHRAFQTVLTRLVQELPRLRSPHGAAPEGPVARRMARAVAPFYPTFVTPMAAVAGSVADHLLSAMLIPGHGLTSLHVNNGGDIALWTAGPVLTAAICDNPLTGHIATRAHIAPGDGIGGIATSGWRGRSLSMGVADAVTVLARDAATADAAATLIANAVDLPGHPAVKRQPAYRLSPDSDLGDRRITTDVGPLTPADTATALDRGAAVAQDYLGRGLIRAACLACQGEHRLLGAPLTTLTKDLTYA
ncbi:UPF0280 family protein [Pseudooceanicola sp. C21-150M6]|uniref:UPF0280 family protein n=1 Tax=Pseudooceanicola sp. C21-150M6 TaxID=3434355 RepID=UPI003D7FA800